MEWENIQPHLPLTNEVSHGAKGMVLFRKPWAPKRKNTLIKILLQQPNESTDNEAGKMPASPENSLDKCLCHRAIPTRDSWEEKKKNNVFYGIKQVQRPRLKGNKNNTREILDYNISRRESPSSGTSKASYLIIRWRNAVGYRKQKEE